MKIIFLNWYNLFQNQNIFFEIIFEGNQPIPGELFTSLKFVGIARNFSFMFYPRDLNTYEIWDGTIKLPQPDLENLSKSRKWIISILGIFICLVQYMVTTIDITRSNFSDF